MQSEIGVHQSDFCSLSINSDCASVETQYQTIAIVEIINLHLHHVKRLKI